MAKAILFLTLINVLFFTLVSSTYVCPPPLPKVHHPKPTPTPKTPAPTPKTPAPTPKTPAPTPKTPAPTPKTPSPTPSTKSKCPINILKLKVCGNLLNDLVSVVIGSSSKTPCCSLIGNLADADAALCLCTAIKASVLGTNLNVQVSLTLLLNNCGKNAPKDFQCA